MKINHNYKQAYLSMRCAPPPCNNLVASDIVNSEEGVELHLPPSEEGAF